MNHYIISKGQKLSDIMPQIESNINLAKNFLALELPIWKSILPDPLY